MIEVKTATSQNYTPSVVTALSMTFDISPVFNYAIAVDDRVLFKDQNDPAQNGVWVCKSVDRKNWQRDGQAASWITIRDLEVSVLLGPYADTRWGTDVAETGTLGTTPITIERMLVDDDEVVTSRPLTRPPHRVTIDVTPHGDVVSHTTAYATYVWNEERLDDDPEGIIVLPAMYQHDAGVELTFTATIIRGIGEPNIVEIYWDFGDGTEGFGSPITHTYKLANIGTIAHCRTTDANGEQAWASMNLMFGPGEPDDGLNAGDWVPWDAVGPPELLDGSLKVLANYSTTYPSQASWNANARPVNYFDILVDTHPKLAHRWKLNDTSGSTVIDSKGDVDGTLSAPVTKGEPDRYKFHYYIDKKAYSFRGESTFDLSVTIIPKVVGDYPQYYPDNRYDYTYWVLAFDADGEFLGSSNQWVGTQPPVGDEHNYELSWDAVSGAARYKIIQNGQFRDYVEAPTTTYEDAGWWVEDMGGEAYSTGPDALGKIVLGDLGISGTDSFSVMVLLKAGAVNSIEEYNSLNAKVSRGSSLYAKGPRALLRAGDTPIYEDSTTIPSVPDYTTNSTATANTTATFTVPANTQVGDVLLTWCWVDGVISGGFPNNADWRNIGFNISNVTGPNWFVRARVATGSDTPGTVHSFTLGSSTGWCGGMLRVLNSENDLDRWTELVTEGAIPPTPDLHNEDPNQLLLHIVGDNQIGGSNFTSSGDLSRIVQVKNATMLRPTSAVFETDLVDSDRYAPNAFGGQITPTTGNRFTLSIRPKRNLVSPVNGWSIDANVQDFGTPKDWVGRGLRMTRWHGTTRELSKSDSPELAFLHYTGTYMWPGLSDTAGIRVNSGAISTPSTSIELGNVASDIADVAIFQPALTAAEATAIYQAQNNPINSFTSGFYNTTTLGQYNNVRVTMKYNIGSVDGYSFNDEGEDFQPFENTPRISVSLKEEGIDQSGNGARISCIVYNSDIWIQTDNGFYLGEERTCSGDFAATANFDEPNVTGLDLWDENQEYWLVFEVNGNDFRVRHYDADPATNDPVVDGSFSLTGTNAQTDWGPGVFGGVGIGYWSPPHNCKILAYDVEAL